MQKKKQKKHKHKGKEKEREREKEKRKKSRKSDSSSEDEEEEEPGRVSTEELLQRSGVTPPYFTIGFNCSFYYTTHKISSENMGFWSANM